MKRLAFFFAFISFFMTAFADWTYGTAVFFKGDKPSNSMNIGNVIVYYNGFPSQKSIEGNTEYWEGTGNICVIYPRTYTGAKWCSHQLEELCRFNIINRDCRQIIRRNTTI